VKRLEISEFQFRTEGAVDIRAFRPFRAAPIYCTVPEASHLATIFGSFAAAILVLTRPLQPEVTKGKDSALAEQGSKCYEYAQLLVLQNED